MRVRSTDAKNDLSGAVYRRRDKRRKRRVIGALTGVIAFVAILWLGTNVAREISAQRSAESDNMQWSLAQAEVEFQEFFGHLRIGADLASIRRRFDIFYSRVDTINQARSFAELRANPEFAEHLSEILLFLETTVPMIDSDNVALTQSMPRLSSLSQNLRLHVRGLANSGLDLFTVAEDRQRQAVSRTLIQLAVALAILINTLGFGVVYLTRLNFKLTEQSRDIRQTADRIKAIMSTSLDAVIVSNDKGEIIGFNRAAENIFGYSAKDVMGRDLGKMIVPDHLYDAHTEGMHRMRRGGEKRVIGKGRVKLDAKRADQTIFPVELAVQSTRMDEGQIYIAFLRDISKRVLEEAELIDARDRAIAGERSRSEFLATMSHEIRTPLNGLMGNMSLLRDTRLTAKQDIYLSNMETSGRLLLDHVTDVLDIARYDSGHTSIILAPLNISDLLQKIVDNQSGMAAANDTTLVWGWKGPQQNWIKSDHDRIQHVLMNLIGNAVKFTKAGRVSVSVAWEDDIITFEVEDTGIGISEAFKDKMFDDFVTSSTAYDRDVGGTGLGLSIVKRFVSALDGEITVNSIEGKGSTFQVALPAEHAEPNTTAPSPQHETADQPIARPQNILVVEDNEINRFVVRNMLIADGHQVTEANDGKQGVEAAYSARFDLILMDISMPVMDGRIATQQIREGNGASAKTRILALTASAMAEERKDFMAHGMDGVLTKPLSKSALRAALLEVSTHSTPPLNTLIDAAHNAETREIAGAKNYPELYARFVTEVSDTITWLSTATTPSEIAAQAHKIAGNAALFGATALRQKLSDIEQAAKRGDAHDTRLAITALPEIWQDTQAAFRELPD